MSTFLASIQILKKAYADLVGEILLDGQPAYDETNDILRIGDGSDPFEDLPIFKAERYKVFTALVTQADTSAPTMTILENTLSGTPVFSYDAVGEYELTLAGEFVNNKTAIFTSVIINNNLARSYTAVRVSNDVIEVKSYNSGTLANTMLSNSLLEIRIYE
jgi:hypothetical protein